MIDLLLLGKLDTELITFALTDVSPGVEKKATVLVQNRSNESIEFVEVETGCKCTEAKVPRRILATGESAQLDFKFTVPLLPSKLFETFEVTLHTRGARKTIRVRFEARLENAVVFERGEQIYSFNGKSHIVTCSIPFLASSTELIEECRVTCSDNLAFTTFRIERENNEPIVRCKFFSRSMAEESVTGEVRLVRGEKTAATMLLTLKKQPDIEILPTPIVFVPMETDANSREGIGILKVRPEDKNQPRSVRVFEARSSDGDILTTVCTRITDEIYRIKIVIKDARDFVVGEGIAISLETSDGRKFSINLKCVFSN